MFFNQYEKIFYKFGDETKAAVFQNLTLYTDLIDQIKDDLSFYEVVTVQEGERPDQVSQRVYGSPAYYWTFYLMNDKLRAQGWPVDRDQLIEKLKRKFPHYTLTLRRDISQTFLINTFVTGNTSSARGKIIHRNLDLGQVIVELDDPNVVFAKDEIVTITTPTTITEQLYGASYEYLAAKYYVDGSGSRVDFDPLIGPGGLLTEKTILDDVNQVNDDLRLIRAIRPEYLDKLTSAYVRAVKS